MAIDISDFSAPDPASSTDASHLIVQRPESVAAFIGRASRGPVNEPVIVASFDEFRRVFGGHGSLGFLSIAAQQFFQHGGRVAAIVRVANHAMRARLDLPANGQLLRLHAREPGGQTVLRASVDYDGLRANEKRFNLVVQRLARPASQLVEDQELFSGLSMNESDDRFVVDALRGSELVQLGGPLPDYRPDATRAEHPGQPLPYVEMSRSGSDGEELTDYDIVGSNDERTGLFALDDLPRVDLLNIPLLATGADLGVTTFLAAERYCARRRATLIWDPPWAWRSTATALARLRDSGCSSADAMTYFPRVSAAAGRERHPLGIPAGGAIAGLLASADRAGCWRPEAVSPMRLKSGLAPLETLAERECTLLKRGGVNVFASRSPHGAVLEGNVSLAGAKAFARLWQRLDRRRLLAYVLKTLEQRTRWALRADWDRELEHKLVGEVRAFLEALFEGGALYGSSPEHAFFVKLKGAIQGEDRELVLRVGLALERPSAFQVYDVVHRVERSIASPAPPREVVELAS